MGFLEKKIFVIIFLVLFSLSSLLYAKLYVKNILINPIDGDLKLNPKKVLQTHGETKFDKLLGTRKYLDTKVIEKDKKRIKDFYLRHGFRDVSVKSEITRNPSENYAVVGFYITQGERYTVDTIIVKNGKLPITREQTLSTLPVEKGEYYNFTITQRIGRGIRLLYSDKGYPYTQVTPKTEINSEENTVSLILKINPSRKVYIGDITYEGLKYNQKKVVQRELKVNEGDFYSISAIKRSETSLYESELFSFVDVTPDSSFKLQKDTVGLIVNVVEKERNWISLHSTFGADRSYDLTVDFIGEWGHRTLFGTGRRLSLEVLSRYSIIQKWENLKNRINLSYSEPYLLGKTVPLKVDFFYQPQQWTEGEAYKLQRFGANLTGTYEPNTDIDHMVTASYEQVDFYGVESEQVKEEIKESEGIITQRKVNYDFLRDTRDNLLMPKNGSLFHGNTALAGLIFGGDEDFLKAKISLTKYLTIFDDVVIAGRVKGGVIDNLTSRDVILPTNRFYLGGANTVRGFAERQIGPKDENGNPLGGKLLYLNNLEIRFPLFWKFHGNIFLDGGNIWGEPTDFDISGTKVSTGGGLHIITPIGPVRFEYGEQILGIDQKTHKSFHFAVHYSF